MGMFASAFGTTFFFWLCYLKMISTIDVKLLRRWGERINVWEG
jgi:hypothetical protein